MTNPTPSDSAQLPPLPDTVAAFRDKGTFTMPEQFYPADVIDAREALRAQAASVEPVGEVLSLDGEDGYAKVWLYSDANIQAGALLYAGAPPAHIPAAPDIRAMATRLMGWKLPKDFSPDGGISFKRESDYDHPEFGRTKFEPIGTNLFSVAQAEQMLAYLFEAQPRPMAATSPATAVDAVDERVPVDEVLEIVESYGPWGKDINESLQFQIILADEVRRLRVLYELAVAGRAEMRSALKAEREAEAAVLICETCGVDRFKLPCAAPNGKCPVRGTTLATKDHS